MRRTAPSTPRRRARLRGQFAAVRAGSVWCSLPVHGERRVLGGRPARGPAVAARTGEGRQRRHRSRLRPAPRSALCASIPPRGRPRSRVGPLRLPPAAGISRRPASELTRIRAASRRNSQNSLGRASAASGRRTATCRSRRRRRGEQLGLADTIVRGSRATRRRRGRSPEVGGRPVPARREGNAPRRSSWAENSFVYRFSSSRRAREPSRAVEDGAAAPPAPSSTRRPSRRSFASRSNVQPPSAVGAQHRDGNPRRTARRRRAVLECGGSC